MNKLKIVQITSFVLVAGLLAGIVIGTDVYGEVERQITKVLCLSCAKLDYKTVVSSQFETANGKPHPKFVLENITKGVVVLHYSADACTGCDIIFPTVKDFFNIEFEKQDMFYAITQVQGNTIPYIYNNVDHTSREMQDSYHIYDIDGKGARPMMTIITLKYHHGIVEPYYASIYGTFGDNSEERIQFLNNLLKNSISIYNENKIGYNPD